MLWLVNEPQKRFPGKKLSLCGHSYLLTGICISALSKRHEQLRPLMFAAPVAGASVCTVRYCKYKRRHTKSNIHSQGRSNLPQKDSVNELIMWKNESVSRSCNWCQIYIGISVCVMSSEYFTRTSLHLVRLKIFEWIKCLRRYLHQIQGNWAGRNFTTESRVNWRLITYARMHTEMNLKSTTTNGLTFE